MSTDNHKHNVAQIALMKGRGTQSVLLAHYNDIYNAISEGNITYTVFLDFAKAFEKL